MTYRLVFSDLALKDWRKLDNALKLQFEKKLAERLETPRVPSAALRDMPGCYRIKLRDAGYRLVYQVIDSKIVVMVIAVAKREDNAVYKIAKRRLNDLD